MLAVFIPHRRDEKMEAPKIEEVGGRFEAYSQVFPSVVFNHQGSVVV